VAGLGRFEYVALYYILVRNLKGEYHLEYFGIDDKIILKFIMKV
jgi:hypothetical protein